MVHRSSNEAERNEELVNADADSNGEIIESAERLNKMRLDITTVGLTTDDVHDKKLGHEY